MQPRFNAFCKRHIRLAGVQLCFYLNGKMMICIPKNVLIKFIHDFEAASILFVYLFYGSIYPGLCKNLSSEKES